MIQGMTGHGRGEATAPGLSVVVEARTVNHRFLDVGLHGSSLPPRVETAVREAVAARLSRGRADLLVTLTVTDPDAAPVRVNVAAMHALVAALRDLGREMNVADTLSLDHIAALPWARAIESVEVCLTPEQESAVTRATGAAIDGVVALRAREGEELARDLGERLRSLQDLVARARAGSASWPARHLERLRARMAELLKGQDVDPARLMQEAALLADKTDASEEIARLSAYLERLSEMLVGSGPSGKRLEFTLQEALREVNTLGSKSRDLAVSSLVIDMKAELERMREQAANVE